MASLETALEGIAVEGFDSMTWDVLTSVVDRSGWQAAKLVVSGRLTPGLTSRGHLIARHAVAAVIHDAGDTLDHLRLFGLPGVPAAAAGDAAGHSAVDEGSQVASFMAAYASGDAHGMARACRPDARYAGPWPGVGFRARPGTTGYVGTDGKPMWRALFDAFTDFHLAVERVIGGQDNNSVAVEVVMGGRQIAPWLHIGNFGRSFTIPGVIFFDIGHDGRITSVDEVFDFDGTESQLLTLVEVCI